MYIQLHLGQLCMPETFDLVQQMNIQKIDFFKVDIDF